MEGTENVIRILESQPNRRKSNQCATDRNCREYGTTAFRVWQTKSVLANMGHEYTLHALNAIRNKALKSKRRQRGKNKTGWNCRYATLRHTTAHGLSRVKVTLMEQPDGITTMS